MPGRLFVVEIQTWRLSRNVANGRIAGLQGRARWRAEEVFAPQFTVNRARELDRVHNSQSV